MQVCTYSDLLPLTAAAEERMNADRRGYGMPDAPFPEEFGLHLIKNSLAQFVGPVAAVATAETGARCGCAAPCIVSMAALAGAEEEEEEEGGENRALDDAEVQLYFKVRCRDRVNSVKVEVVEVKCAAQSENYSVMS